MTQTEATISTSQETIPPSPPPVQKRPVKRTEIKINGAGQNLYYLDPVCPYCRAKKIACHHRAIYDDFGNLVRAAEEPPKLDDPKPTSSQPKKASMKFIKPIVPFGTDGENAAKTESASQRPRRANAVKRKLENFSIEHTAPTDSKRQKTERKKPGPKPREKTPI
ncbi:hypothetical protein F66182_13403, partial [Fusarium sp. NRRL 66182]